MTTWLIVYLTTNQARALNKVVAIEVVAHGTNVAKIIMCAAGSFFVWRSARSGLIPQSLKNMGGSHTLTVSSSCCSGVLGAHSSNARRAMPGLQDTSSTTCVPALCSTLHWCSNSSCKCGTQPGHACAQNKQNVEKSTWLDQPYGMHAWH
jgi:hypothetical protein